MEMIQNIDEIKHSQMRAEIIIKDKTLSKYPNHVRLVQTQYSLLQEFLANYYRYGNIKHKDSNQFIVCFSLMNSMIKKEKICLELIQRGYYQESAELIRHIMQSCFHLLYMAKHKDSWREWMNQQGYEDDKLVNNTPTNPHTIFSSKFENFLKALGKERYYRLYQKLCSWSHPGIEDMRASIELKPGNSQKYFYTQQFNEEHCEFQMNLLYGFINVSFWEGFKELFIIALPIPDALEKYKKIQEGAMAVFSRFYLP